MLIMTNAHEATFSKQAYFILNNFPNSFQKGELYLFLTLNISKKCVNKGFLWIFLSFVAHLHIMLMKQDIDFA